jgi:hypothetical protein
MRHSGKASRKLATEATRRVRALEQAVAIIISHEYLDLDSGRNEQLGISFSNRQP